MSTIHVNSSHYFISLANEMKPSNRQLNYTNSTFVQTICIQFVMRTSCMSQRRFYLQNLTVKYVLVFKVHVARAMIFKDDIRNANKFKLNGISLVRLKSPKLILLFNGHKSKAKKTKNEC